MSAFPISYEGKAFRTSEALFQWMRFQGHPDIQERILAAQSPMGCKMTCKQPDARAVVGTICDQVDLVRMELCLLLKLDQHPQLQKALIDTGWATIIEDCGKRPDIEIDGKNYGNGLPFWGAKLIDGQWQGKNALGVIWMKLRAELVLKGGVL